MTTQPQPQESAEAWAAYHLAAAIRHLADAIREGLESLARAIREQRQQDDE